MILGPKRESLAAEAGIFCCGRSIQRGKKTDEGQVRRGAADTTRSYLLKKWTGIGKQTQQLSLEREVNLVIKMSHM